MEQRCSDYDQSRRDIPSFIEPRPPLIQNPFMRPRPQKGINLMERFEEDESDIEEPELVQVYLRMKPCNVPNNLYEVRSDTCLVTSLDTATAGHGRRTHHNVSRMYRFSHIFTSESSQKEIFEQVVKENLKKLVEGNSFTLLTYGASGSGKTYTLMGTVNSPGLIPRSLEYLFKLVDAAQMPIYKPSDNGAELLKCSRQEYELQWVKRLRNVSAPLRDKYRRVSAQLHNDFTLSSVDLTDRSKYYVWVSFVEIYNEAIYDLLAPPENRVKMRIREDTAGNVYVKGVTQAFVRSGEEAYDVMVAGKHNLIVGATGIHAKSSRSHCIFTITVLAENDGDVRVSHVRLCDLAGCERQRATRNTGARMQESRAINSSLHVLERCLHMLRRKQRLTKDSHLVPYRESKLTRLLGSGLSGSRGEAVSMVVTLNPAPQYASESKHVLSLAAVAQDIQINQTMLTSTTHITDSSTQDTTIYSSAETMRLREENDRLHYELVQSERRIKELVGSMEESQRQATVTMLEISNETKELMTQYYEAIITSLKSEIAELKEENERILENPPCCGSAAGSPLRCLQAKITQLKNEIVILKNKISEEMLARARAEKEVQHLRNCIEERDDESIEFEEDEPKTVVKNPVKVSETSVSKGLSCAMQGSIFLENDEFDEESSEDLSIKNVNIKRGTFFLTGPSSLSLKSIEFEEEEEDEPKTEVKNSVKVSETSVSKIINSGKTDSSLTQFEQLEMVTNDLDNSKDKSVDLVDVNIFSKKRNYLEYDAEEGAIDTTNTVQHKKLMTEVFKEHENGSETLPNMKNIKTQDTETIVSKIIKSQKPDSSLAQFETLEMAVNDLEKCDNKNSDLVDVDMLRKKRNYLDGITQEEPIATTATEKFNNGKLPTGFVENYDNRSEMQLNVETGFKSNYFDENYGHSSTHLSDAAKIQEKVLYFDNSATGLNLVTNSKNHEQSSKTENENSDNNLKIVPSTNNQEKPIYFDDNDKTSCKDIVISSSDTQKRTYFHNKDPIIKSAVKKNVNAIIINSFIDHDRSPSIVKDDIQKDFNPSNAMKQLLGDAVMKPEMLSTIYKQNIKKHDSLDVFKSPEVTASKAKDLVLDDNKMNENVHKAEENLNTIAISLPIKVEELNIENNNELNEKVGKTGKPLNNKEIILPANLKELSSIETVRKSVEQLGLAERMKVRIKQEIKIEPGSPEESTPETLDKQTSESNSEQFKNKIVIPLTSDQAPDDARHYQENNTINEFEKIVKDLSNSRASQFDLLFTDEVSVADTTRDKGTAQSKIAKDNDIQRCEKPKEKKEISEKTVEFEDIKYNLRHAGKPKPKKNLRLKKQKKIEVDSENDSESKLKDIINLQKEFCDVTMNLPAVQKEVKDILSPEKLPGHDENVPPVMGIQSCPSKSVTRSRRKLFTPRAEPLEESPTRTEDSSERLYVPRPSYHRTRARRKL